MTIKTYQMIAGFLAGSLIAAIRWGWIAQNTATESQGMMLHWQRTAIGWEEVALKNQKNSDMFELAAKRCKYMLDHQVAFNNRIVRERNPNE